MLDTHAMFKRFTEAGFTEAQAEVLADTWAGNFRDLATKADLAPLATKAELASLATKAEIMPLATKAEIAPLATKAEIAPLATKAEIAPLATKAELAELRREMATKKDLAELKAGLLMWMVPLLAGILISILSLVAQTYLP